MPRLAGKTAPVADDEWDVVVDINLTSVFRALRAVVPATIERGQGGSPIVSSLAGLRGLPDTANHVAVKHGLAGLARTKSNELGQFSIRTSTVHPTTTNTPWCATSRRTGCSERTGELARAALWLSGESSYVTGSDLTVDGGLMARVPLDLE
jgi:NAD(P)-dependent dehydrogenase (short-subunit alcohol dehydrogenase family)